MAGELPWLVFLTHQTETVKKHDKQTPQKLSSVQLPALPFVPLHPVGGCFHALPPLFQLFCCAPFGSAQLGPDEVSSAGFDSPGVTPTSSLPAAVPGSASLSICTFPAFRLSTISCNLVLEKTEGECMVEAGDSAKGLTLKPFYWRERNRMMLTSIGNSHFHL